MVSHIFSPPLSTMIARPTGQEVIEEMNKKENGKMKKMKRVVAVVDKAVCDYNASLDSAFDEIVKVLKLSSGHKSALRDKFNTVIFNNESNTDEEIILYVAKLLGIPEEKIPDRKYLEPR